MFFRFVGELANITKPTGALSVCFFVEEIRIFTA